MIKKKKIHQKKQETGRKMKYLLLLVLLSIVGMSFTYKEKPTKFKYCRVQVTYEETGMVIDADGVMLFREDAIIMRSNNGNSDAIFVIEKEVAPEIETHKAWLTYNTRDKDISIVVEYGQGEGVKLTEITTGYTSFFFSAERKKDFEPLPESNVWYEYPKGGGELRKSD